MDDDVRVFPYAEQLDDRMGGMVKLTWLQPHNCRVYFSFKALGDGYKLRGFPLNKSEYLFKDVDLCDVRVKKRFIEVFFKGFRKNWFMIRFSDRKLVAGYLHDLIIREATQAFRKFCELYDFTSDFRVVKERIEVGELGDVSKIPRGMTVDWTDFKRVYASDKLEWKSWEALNESSQGDVDALGRIEGKIDDISLERVEFDKSLGKYTEQINLHLKVEERQLRVQEETIKTLKSIRKELKKDRVREILKENGW